MKSGLAVFSMRIFGGGAFGATAENSHNFDDKYVVIPIDFALCRDKIYFQTDKGNLTRNIFIQPDKT